MQLPTLEEETALWAAGFGQVAGIDEAGRGAWAGPVVAAAVVLPASTTVASALAGVADSKQVSPAQRAALFPVIHAHASGVGVGVAPSSHIDVVGIAAATREAMRIAIAHLPVAPDFLLIDYVRLAAVPLPQRSLIKGDARALSIAAASIVAKVIRDRLMVDLARSHPNYGFARNKGYGTADHRQALWQWGPCSEHRFSFQPVEKCLAAIWSVESSSA